jgi:hypothetical protein
MTLTNSNSGDPSGDWTLRRPNWFKGFGSDAGFF